MNPDDLVNCKWKVMEHVHRIVGINGTPETFVDRYIIATPMVDGVLKNVRIVTPQQMDDVPLHMKDVIAERLVHYLAELHNEAWELRRPS